MILCPGQTFGRNSSLQWFWPPNPRLERTGAQPARHGPAAVGAGRSTAGR